MIRPRSKERALRIAVLVAGDLLIGAGALAFGAELRQQILLQWSLPARQQFVPGPLEVALFSLSLGAALMLSGFYHDRMTPRARPSVVTAVVIQMILVVFGAAVIVHPLPRTILASVALLELFAIPLWRRALRSIAPIRPRNTILLGDAESVDAALRGLHMDGDRRIRLVGSFEATLEELHERATRERLRDVDEVILVSPDSDWRLRLELLRVRGPRGYLMLASHVDALLTSRTLGWLGDQPLVEVAVSCGYGVNAAIKRTVDVVGALLLLIATVPLWIFAAAAIWLEDRGPIIIRQTRVGRRGEPYGMWKFRSMRAASQIIQPDSARLTRTGALLRRYHVDELPQLMNVLLGDMSLVGPRPELPELAAAIARSVPDFDLRAMVRPGIAGLAQVSSEYDTRPEVKLRYDLMYMCDWSVWLDLRLMFRAVSSSLAGTGR